MFFFRKKNKDVDLDALLIEKYRNSYDLSYLAELFQRYSHIIFGICLKYLKQREDAEDAVMEIFEHIAVELKKKHVREFKAWIYVVAKNHCLMKLRKNASLQKNNHTFTLVAKDIMESYSQLHLFDEESHKEEIMLAKLEEGIKQLNDEQRTCIELFYFSQKSYEEIANLTGYELSKVKSHLQNGKRNLKIYLEKNNETQR